MIQTVKNSQTTTSKSFDFAVKRGRALTMFKHADSALAYHQSILGSVMLIRSQHTGRLERLPK